MKAICLNINNCGVYFIVEEDDEPVVCPDCFGPMMIINKYHKPLLYELDDEEKIDETLAYFHNLISKKTD